MGAAAAPSEARRNRAADVSRVREKEGRCMAEVERTNDRYPRAHSRFFIADTFGRVVFEPCRNRFTRSGYAPPVAPVCRWSAMDGPPDGDVVGAR